MIAGVGYSLDKVCKINLLDKRIYGIWVSMIYKCYSKSNSNYRLHGAKGVTVCERWHCFEHFYEDFFKIEGYDEELFEKERNLILDKDVKQSHLPKSERVYSLDTCKFVSNRENSIRKDKDNSFMGNVKKAIKVISPTGEVFVYDSQKDCVNALNLNYTSVSQCVNGKQKKHKGFTFERVLYAK